MRLLRRDGRPDGATQAIERFWQWWAVEGRAATTEAIAAGRPETAGAAMTRALAQISPGLGWEMAAGTAAEHLLVVSPEGDPALRRLAHQWLRAAPAADRTWEYAASRRPVPDVLDVVLLAGEREVPLSQVVVGARREVTHVDVTVHHPVFAELDDATRQQMALLALDATLGEDDVEAWVGDVEVSTVPPLDGFDLTGLRAVVRDLRDDHTDADGSPVWVTLHAEGQDGPVLAQAQVPLSPVTAPELDTHVAVLVPYTDRTAEGFPGPGSMEALRRLQDTLVERIGSSGRVVAHQSHRGMRVLHLYVDSGSPAVEQMRAAVQSWDQGRIRVQVTPDPGWHNVAHLRG